MRQAGRTCWWLGTSRHRWRHAGRLRYVIQAVGTALSWQRLDDWHRRHCGEHQLHNRWAWRTVWQGGWTVNNSCDCKRTVTTWPSQLVQWTNDWINDSYHGDIKPQDVRSIFYGRIQKIDLGGHLQCPFLSASLDAKLVESETTQASMGWGMGRGYPSPADSGIWESVVSSLSGVRGGAPAEIEFCKIWEPKKPSDGTYFTEFHATTPYWLHSCVHDY